MEREEPDYSLIALTAAVAEGAPPQRIYLHPADIGVIVPGSSVYADPVIAPEQAQPWIARGTLIIRRNGTLAGTVKETPEQVAQLRAEALGLKTAAGTVKKSAPKPVKKR